jgi:hypothetical protein
VVFQQWEKGRNIAEKWCFNNREEGRNIVEQWCFNNGEDGKNEENVVGK